MTECIFCAWGNEMLNQVLVENETWFLRRDNFPVVKGHMELVPKRHVISFFDLTLEEMQDLYTLLPAAQRLDADGYTIGVNEGAAAGRTIDHLHIHVIPRRWGDMPDPQGGIRQLFANPLVPYPLP